MKLAGKQAFVTGAGRGIGYGCAIELAKAGADVAINDLNESDHARKVVEEIQGLGRKSKLIAGDVFQRESCEQVAAAALEFLGGIDIFVSNPAYSRRSPFLDYPPELFQKVLQGVLVGGFHMSQLMAREMVRQGRGGKIVFISSVHSRIPYANSVAYNAGKAGINHMAATIAVELIPHKINVNAIEPGWIDTPGEHEAFGDQFMEENGPKLPWGRMGTPNDIGRAAAFLCSSDADYITGTTLLVDGGLSLRDARE